MFEGRRDKSLCHVIGQQLSVGGRDITLTWVTERGTTMTTARRKKLVAYFSTRMREEPWVRVRVHLLIHADI